MLYPKSQGFKLYKWHWICAVYSVNTGSEPFSCDQYLVSSYYREIVKPDFVFK